MILETLPSLVLLTVVVVLSLRFVPKRWNSVDIQVGLKGLRLTAEESPNDTQ